MLSPYLRRIVVDFFLFIALCLGVLYVYKIFLDFLISLFHFEGTRNLPSIAYCVQRSLFVLLPLIMLTFTKKIPKIKIFKAMFFIIGICYLIGNTWVIYYALENPVSNLFISSIPKWFLSEDMLDKVQKAHNSVYVFQYNKALVFNYLIWDSYNLFGVIFSTIQGILYIQLSRILDSSRGLVLRKMLTIIVLSLTLPLLYNIIVQKSFFMSENWITRNLLLIFENIFIYIALVMAAQVKNFWMEVLW